MKEENCPCCHNHYSKDNLKCGRGENYFNRSNEIEKNNSMEDQILIDLRKCGHTLHHNKNLDSKKSII